MKVPTIAVINSNEDTAEMVRACLQSHGFSFVMIGRIAEIRRSPTDFLQFVATHDPRIFVWDIGIPYEENWHFAHLMIDSEQMRGRRVVLTTTNKRALDALVGRTETIEIIGKPYDLDQIVQAVKKIAGITADGA